MTIVDDIRTRLDIVDVVSSHINLQKAGKNFKAPCPFHTERTPSFIVNPERQSWHCFGACSTGGDAFSFVMRHQNIEFGEALRILAQKAGVELSKTSKQDSDKRSKLQAVNRLTATYYQECLKSPQGAAALNYLRQRGVNREMIEAFQLGYSPNSWDTLKTYLKRMGVPEEQAVDAGVIHRNDESGRTWDFFRDRLMFPIHDRQGNIIGFGGRQLTEPPPNAPGYNPKYINTSRTLIFDKRSSLYGIHRAHSAIRESNTGIIVEGYMDVIAAHQHGSKNIVASMGTALTENQVTQLKSLASNFILSLDPDTAGQEATLRSLEASWKVIGSQSPSRSAAQGVLHRRDPITLSIAALPEGKDPDELIRHNPAEWDRIIETASPLMSYLIPAIASRFDTNTGQGKTQVVEAIYPLIAATQNPFDQQRYLQNLADALSITLDALKAGLPRATALSGRYRQRRQSQSGSSQPADRPQVSVSALNSSREHTWDNFLLGMLLQRPQLRAKLGNFSPECLRSSADREVFNRWLICEGVDELESSLDEPLQSHLHTLMNENIAPRMDTADSERAFTQCMQRIQNRHERERQETLLATIDSSTPPPREMMDEITKINAAIKATELR